MPPIHLKRTLLLALSFACRVLSPAAQEPAPFENIATAQGLSQGMIFGMLQDKEGFIWVATKEGLNRYDGYNFRVFTNDPANPFSLSSNYIRTVFEDSKGRIWAATLDAGLNVYDKKTGRFHRIMNQPGNTASLSNNRMKSGILELADGKILVAPENGGLNTVSLPDDYFEKNSSAVIRRFTLPGNNQPHGIGKDDKGKIWVGCAGKQIYLFDASAGSFELLCDGKKFTAALTHAGRKIWASRDVLVKDSMIVYRPFDTTGRLIPGTLARNGAGDISIGPYGYPPPGLAHSHFYDFRQCAPGGSLSAAQNIIFTSTLINLQVLMIDRAGIVWAGTDGNGLRKYNLAASRFHHIAAGFSVRNIVPTPGNSLYLASWKKDILLNVAGQPLSTPWPAKLLNSQVNNFLISRRGEYWVWKEHNPTLSRYNSLGKLLASYSLSLRSSEEKQQVLEDRNGFIWVCGLSGELARIDPSSGYVIYYNIDNGMARPLLANSQITAMYQDAQAVFWIGTEEGFVRLQPKGNAGEADIRWYTNTDSNSLNYNYVSCFLDDPSDSNYLWICTKGGGLNRLQKATGKFTHLTTRDGLPNDVVYGIMGDKAANIWGSTNRGLFCMLAKDRENAVTRFRNFTASDGLQGEEFNTGAFARLESGDLIFGGVNGLNIFTASELLATGYQPEVYITNILIGNKAVQPGDNTAVLNTTIETTPAITLTYQQDILTLEFSSLDFTAPLQNKYRYQLVGIDEQWVESDRRRSATYLHLPAGEYTFRVQASNSQGEWSSRIRELSVRVLPPWWLTWWACIGYAIVVISFGVAWFRFFVNRATLRSQLAFEQREAKRVRELDYAKTQLYTNITHEFRTPLTVIMGMAQQVIHHPEEKFATRMEMIVRNGQNLLNLVNEMLDLSKLETGKMGLQLVNGDVMQFLRYITDSFHPIALGQRKQLLLLTEIESLQASYDPEKVRQIVTNLLSNALKFTPENGNIYITIGKDETAADDAAFTLIIRVKDNGIGIPEDQWQHVFERFYQLRNSNNGKSEGTGIGLALTRELVNLMKGSIAVKSPPSGSDKGTEFTVSLPMQKSTEKAAPMEQREGAVSTGPEKVSAPLPFMPDDTEQQPLILLVEDNADVVAYTSSCLTGYRVAVGRDGREGLSIAGELIPDLVITDVMMPFIDGLELCRTLRASEHTSHIPVIMLTAKADFSSRMEGLEHGADVYLEKPFRPEELLVRIKKLLETRTRLQQYYLRTAGLANPVSLTSAIEAPGPVPEKTENIFVARVREAIERNIDNPEFTVENLSRLVFMSHSQLHRKLDAVTGYSPNKFIRIIRLNRSKELLSMARNTVASVALDCGYNDPAYFARVFKQEFGCTPQEWRSG